MTYFADMSSRCQFAVDGDPIRAIGWLHFEHPFEKGWWAKGELQYEREFYLQKLQHVFMGWHHRGLHSCEFCHNESGNGCLVVPDKKYLYVAPVMLGHYISAHDYKPPKVFLTALENCPTTDATCGETMCMIADEYLDLINKLLCHSDEGRSYIDEVKQIRSRGISDWARALAHKKNRNYREAIESASAYLAVNNRHYRAKSFRADCHVELQEFETAIADYNETFDSIDERTRLWVAPGMLKKLAAAYSAIGKIDEAASAEALATEYKKKLSKIQDDHRKRYDDYREKQKRL